MGMPATPTIWTVDMLESLPDDGQRYEIVDGELFVTPAPMPPHQLILMELTYLLATYLRASREALLIASPSDVRRGKRRHVQPDGFVIRLDNGRLPAYPFAISDLLLAIEVNSPGTVRLDYQVKRELYLDERVGEYWILNHEARNLTRWRQGYETGEVLTREVSWRAPDIDQPLVIDLAALFARALSPVGPESESG
jgi:Uma2 family endonuclease